MSIKLFWMILIKILGLILISGLLTVLPQSISSMYYALEGGSFQNILVAALIILPAIFVYFFIIKICLFKTSWIIKRLKLDQGFEEERIEVNFDATKIISIALIVMGGLIFVDSTPVLLREIIVFFQDKNLFKDYPKSGWIIFYFSKTIIGYLLMTNSFRIANFIEKKKQ